MKVQLSVQRSRKTMYKGIEMRSLAEARVAGKLDRLGVKWQYEPRVFVLGKWRVTYLPDFYLPELKVWIEVKGPEPTRYERHKARLLAAGTGEWVFVVWEDGTEAMLFRPGRKGVRIDGF